MATAQQKISIGDFSFSSSIAADVWHPKTNPKAYEWWYFDAISDDGRDALVIIFLDNFVFSPRYNNGKGANGEPKAGNTTDAENPNLSNLQFAGITPASQVPAVAFVYYRDGKPVYRAINEFTPEQFSASRDVPACEIGGCSFKMDAASYGSGYLIKINALLSGNRRLEAAFEWLSVEADFLPEKQFAASRSHSWNMVAPRSDVSGRLAVFDQKNRETDVRHFRGTGYHDHNLDDRRLTDTVRDWHWGRVHYADATAVFYRYNEAGKEVPVTKLLVVRDGVLRERDAAYEETDFKRDKFGIRYPGRMRFESEDALKLRVKPVKIIDSSFFYLRFLSEMTLTLRDGKPRKTVGITEYLKPKALNYRWLNWLINMRIGRRGKGSFLP